MKGDGLAHAGLILGYIGLIPAAIMIVVLIAGGSFNILSPDDPTPPLVNPGYSYGAPYSGN